jgi:hypothetical protein
LTKKERIQAAKTKEYNRRTTLANELDFPDADFFNDEFEKEPSFIMEHTDEEFSPRAAPRDRNNTLNEHLAMMSLDSGSDGGHSFMRKRLIGGVRYLKGLRNKENEKEVKKNIDMSVMNEEEFQKYLLKKYGKPKGLKRYDSMLFNKKKMSVSGIRLKNSNNAS